MLKDKIDNYNEVNYLVSHEGWAEVNEKVQRALESGDTLLAGIIHKEKGVSRPLLIEAKDKDSILLKEELFGFVFTVLPYNNDEEVIELVNKS